MEIKNTTGHRVRGPRKLACVRPGKATLFASGAHGQLEPQYFLSQSDCIHRKVIVVDDIEWMRQYQMGKTEAFDRLYERYSSRVYSFLLKKLKDPQTAEELHQLVFLKFHESRFQYEPKFSVLQWLYVIARSQVTDFYRKQRRQITIDPEKELDSVAALESHSISESMSQNAAVSPLNDIEGLTNEQRQVLQWKVMDDATYEEIAERLGRKPASVRQMVSRLFRRLRGEYER